jgi:hypothetical protein
MASAEQLARMLRLHTRGIRVLLWESKTDLVRALLIAQAALSEFPTAPVVLPTEQTDLQRFSIDLFEKPEESQSQSLRIILIPQASIETIGTWLNGWRSRLADPPGTLLVMRHAEFVALYRRAPDLMSFAHSDVYDATEMLPLVDEQTVKRVSEQLPDAWYAPLRDLPGEMPTSKETADWIARLKTNVE